MPVQRKYVPVSVWVSEGGRLAPDLPVGRVGAANYTEKVNFRRELDAEVKDYGWDYPTATPSWLGDGLADFNDGQPAEQIAGVQRPNGTYAIVGCGAGFIKVFDYDANAWVTIGSGYSTGFDAGFRYWQIEDIAGYAVFNNGRDLPCTWQIGDGAVRPMYEFREAGYASAGGLVEYSEGVAMFYDILEINDADMADVMNDPLPYKTIVDSALTTRITFRYLWSNIGDPRAFAPTVPGAITMGTDDLVLDWPMASFQVGDTLRITGAGTSGGNLQTTIAAISGVNVTLATNAVTTVSGADVVKIPVIPEQGPDGIAGFDDIEDDGSAIVRMVTLKTQCVAFKGSGNIWQGYYTGDVDTPFTFDRMTKEGSVEAPFPRAIINVKDDYLLWPGVDHFYRWSLGKQSADEHPVFHGADQALFFSRIAGAREYEIWATHNACTREIYFAYRWSEYEVGYYGANRVLAYSYASDNESIGEISDFGFLCGATVSKPLSGFTADRSEKWFLMGDGEGKITRMGRSNLAVIDRTRYGEAFESVLHWGLFSPGPDDTASYVRRFSLNPANPAASQATTISIYGATAPNAEPTLLESRTLTNPALPSTMGLNYRKPYFAARLTSTTDQELKIAGHVWRVGQADTQALERQETS